MLAVIFVGQKSLIANFFNVVFFYYQELDLQVKHKPTAYFLSSDSMSVASKDSPTGHGTDIA